MFLVADNQLWSIDAAGGATRVASLADRDVVEVVDHSSTHKVFSPDGGRSVVVLTRHRSSYETGFARVDVTTGAVQQLLEKPMAFSKTAVFATDVSDTGGVLAYAAEDAAHPSDIWVTPPDFSAPRRATNTNPVLSRHALGASRLIEWGGQDGQTIKGAVLLPPGFTPGTRYPVIAEVYGGFNESSALHRFGLKELNVQNLQMFASRGYVVFTPDIPQRVGTPMRDIAAAVNPGFDRLIELGLADPDRLGLIGTSYGGYTVMSLLVQTSRFKAAVVASTAAADLMLAYSTMTPSGGAAQTGWAEEGQGRMGGTPWEFRERYIENSPMYFLDRVTTPVLLIHGALDTVPAANSDALFVGLRRLGKEVVYAKYARGDHGGGSFDRADALDYFERVSRWFDERLKPQMSSGR